MSRSDAKFDGSPRFLLFAVILAGLLILAAGAVIAFALRPAPDGVAGSLLASAIGGPFRLVDQNGKTVTDADLKGKWRLVYFGYTHCPDECPTALNNMSLALDRLGAERSKIGIVFITVDPARDTPAVMKSFVGHFGAPIMALTGTSDAIAQAAKGYHVYYAKHDGSGGDYEPDHGTLIYVMNPQGRFTATLTGDDSPDTMAARLKRLI